MHSSIWVRSSQGVLGGVCKRLAERSQVPALLIRLIWLASILFLGFGLVLYITLVLALPREDRMVQAQRSRIFGGCYRLSQKTEWDVGLIRLACLWLLLLSGGTTLLIYFVLSFLVFWEQSSGQNPNPHPASRNQDHPQSHKY